MTATSTAADLSIIYRGRWVTSFRGTVPGGRRPRHESSDNHHESRAKLSVNTNVLFLPRQVLVEGASLFVDPSAPSLQILVSAVRLCYHDLPVCLARHGNRQSVGSILDVVACIGVPESRSTLAVISMPV